MNKFSMNKWGASAALTALLLMGLLYLVGASHPFFHNARLAQLMAAPNQAATGAVVQAPRRQPANSGLNGIYAGEVAIQGVQTGVYSNTLTLPVAPTGTVPADLGTIELSLQLTQTGASVIGYVLLDRSMTFTTEHTVSISGRGLIEVGPAVRGTYDGTTLTLESERFSSLVSGREIVRQFRLVSNSIEQKGGMISGEYRETLWGFAIEASTAMGAVRLARPDALLTAGAPGDTNTAPAAVNDVASTPAGRSVTINVLANDADAEGDSLTVTEVDVPANGGTTTDGARVIYTPTANFTGTERFTYVVSDSRGATAVGTIIVEVTPPDGKPTPVPSADDDQDGILNQDEDINKDGDLTNDDTDGDGIPNYLDPDDDGDGIPTVDEGNADANGNGVPDYLEKEIPGTNTDRRVFLPLVQR